MTIRFRHQLRRPASGHEGPVRERGTVLVITTITLSMLLVMATLIIDGSQAYPQRRRSQNAADEAALAATRALDRWKVAQATGTSGEDVQAAALSIVEANSAELESCTLIRGNGAEIGPCDDAAALGSPVAAGVEVVASETRQTTFGELVGQESVTARATAKATSQPLATAGSPFVACGNMAFAGQNSKDDPIDILNSTATAIDPVKVAAWVASGTEFVLQGSKVNPCGLGSSTFKGKASEPSNIRLGQWNKVETGNGYNPSIEFQVLGAAPCVEPPYVNCDLLVPIANQGRSSDLSMYVVGWVVFRVRPGTTGNAEYIGKLVGERQYASSGGTTDGMPTSGDIRVIRLIA